MKTPVRIAFLLLTTLFAATGASADCTVAAVGVNFGAYDVLSPSPLDGAGQVEVTCSPSVSYSIALSSGGGTYTTRQLAGSGANLAYNLFTGASRSIVWGDGSGATSTVAGSGTGQVHTVYGRIPAQQNVPAGSYGDTIIVTVTF